MAVEDNKNTTAVFNIKYINRVQHAFAKIAKVSMVMLGLDLQPVTDVISYDGTDGECLNLEAGLFCEDFANTLLCDISNISVNPEIALNLKSKKVIAAAPLIYEAKHVGTWVISQTVDAAQDLSDEKKSAIIEDFRFKLEMLRHMINEFISIEKAYQQLNLKNDELENASKIMRNLIDNSDVHAYVTDFYTGEILMCNSNYAYMIGKAVIEDVVGLTCWEAFGFNKRCSFCPSSKLIDENGEPLEPYVWENNPFGGDKWIRCTSRAIKWVDGRLAHMATFIDITEQRRAGAERTYLAYHDRKLNIPNLSKLELDLRQSADKKNTLICFDIQGLRKINDVYGRETGDLLLDEICSWVTFMNEWDSIWKSAVLYRVDGDEFAVVFQDLPESDEEDAVSQIRRRFTGPWVINHTKGKQQNVFVSATIGIICIENGNVDIKDLPNIIVQVLSVQNSNSPTRYNEEFGESLRERLKMELSLNNCIRENMQGFFVCYQSICSPATGMYSGLEALCRWVSPEVGNVSPKDFISYAEKSGLVIEIDLWVLEQAIIQVHRWGLLNNPEFTLNANVSLMSLNDLGFFDRVNDILNEHNYPHKNLLLEISGTEKASFDPHVVSVLRNLQETGIRICIDDFQTGLSIFANLKNLHVQMIKADRIFLENIETDSHVRNTLFTIVDLAHSQGIEVAMGGIETESELQILIQCGIDKLQGYVFMHPLSAEELKRHMGGFYSSVGVFPAKINQEFDYKKLEDSNSSYPLSSRSYKLINTCMQKILFSTNLPHAIQEVMEIVGTKLKLSRAYVFQKDEDNEAFVKLCEWCGDGIAPRMSALQKSEIPPNLLRILNENGMIIASDIYQLPHEVIDELEALGTKSIIILPLIQADVIKGFIGFDECSESRRFWTPDEIRMLYHLSLLLTSVHIQNHKQNQISKEIELTQNLFNHIALPLFVSNPETHRFEFVNKNFIDVFGEEALESTCHDLFGDEEKPCTFCDDPEFMEQDISYICTREQRCAKNGKFYQIFDSIIPWHRGKRMHLRYMIDLTSIKNYQAKLEDIAKLDLFTNTLNRRALLDKICELLKNPEAQLAVCFIDLDGLKYTNDTFGHAAGDQLILRALDAVRRVVRDNDIIGRYGGDEFVVLLPGCSANLAKERMKTALEILESEFNQKTVGMHHSFSYGIAERSEITDNTQEDTLLVALADHRMLDSKKEKKSKKEYYTR